MSSLRSRAWTCSASLKKWGDAMLKKCVQCGTVFDAGGSDITCGKACSKERYSERKREYRQRPEVKEHRRECNREHQRASRIMSSLAMLDAMKQA